MKKYKVNDNYSILASLPYSFQISTKDTSYRLVDHQDDPEANYPHEITVEQESLNQNYILMYTPRKYMRLAWIDDPDEPNGQIDMGIRTPEGGMDFVSWITLANSIPEEVITMAYFIITSPDSVKQYEVPLYEPRSNNNINTVPLYNEPPPSSSPKPGNNGTKKKRKFKVRKGGSRHQRRLRSF